MNLRFIIVLLLFSSLAVAQDYNLSSCEDAVSEPKFTYGQARVFLSRKRITSRSVYRELITKRVGAQLYAEPYHELRSDWCGWMHYFGVKQDVNYTFDETLDWGLQHGIRTRKDWDAAGSAKRIPDGMLKPNVHSAELLNEFFHAAKHPPSLVADFAEVDAWVREQRFASMAGYRMAVHRGEGPANTPKYPELVYVKEWRDAPSFLHLKITE